MHACIASEIHTYVYPCCSPPPLPFPLLYVSFLPSPPLFSPPLSSPPLPSPSLQKQTCGTVSVEVKKTQHKYVIGPRGQGLQEILAETGVSVEIPSMDSESCTVTLRGPQDKLGAALSKVYERVSAWR